MYKDLMQEAQEEMNKADSERCLYVYYGNKLVKHPRPVHVNCIDCGKPKVHLVGRRCSKCRVINAQNNSKLKCKFCDNGATPSGMCYNHQTIELRKKNPNHKKMQRAREKTWYKRTMSTPEGREKLALKSRLKAQRKKKNGSSRTV